MLQDVSNPFILALLDRIYSTPAFLYFLNNYFIGS